MNKSDYQLSDNDTESLKQILYNHIKTNYILPSAQILKKDNEMDFRVLVYRII